MGQISRIKFFVLICCLCLVGLVVNAPPGKSVPVKRALTLRQALAHIPGWHVIEFQPLDKDIIKTLDLDDYINATYSDGVIPVSLFIGYYLTSKKLGAAHDPMVCFPGQGWTLSQINKESLLVNNTKVSFSNLVAGKGEQKELVIYWYQSYESTSSSTFSQKVSAFLGKISGHPEDNAFIRVTAPVNGNLDHIQKSIKKFIVAFYPQFLNYVHGK